MKLQPLEKYYRLDTPPVFKKRIHYGMGAYIDRDTKSFNGKDYLISSNYVNDSLLCTLIYVSKAGDWIKSKLKYFKDGKVYKTLTSDRTKRVVWSNK